VPLSRRASPFERLPAVLVENVSKAEPLKTLSQKERKFLVVGVFLHEAPKIRDGSFREPDRLLDILGQIGEHEQCLGFSGETARICEARFSTF
jgi:hypothetical protein